MHIIYIFLQTIQHIEFNFLPCSFSHQISWHSSRLHFSANRDPLKNTYSLSNEIHINISSCFPCICLIAMPSWSHITDYTLKNILTSFKQLGELIGYCYHIKFPPKWSDLLKHSQYNIVLNIAWHSWLTRHKLWLSHWQTTPRIINVVFLVCSIWWLNLPK